MTMPEPDADAAESSRRLAALIAAEIEQAGGWISFARYMEMALYAPGLGYYSGGARKFGAAGDFVTAPELSPLFAQTLAAQVEPILAASAPRMAGRNLFLAASISACATLAALPMACSQASVPSWPTGAEPTIGRPAASNSRTLAV